MFRARGSGVQDSGFKCSRRRSQGFRVQAAGVQGPGFKCSDFKRSRFTVQGPSVRAAGVQGSRFNRSWLKTSFEPCRFQGAGIEVAGTLCSEFRVQV